MGGIYKLGAIVRTQAEGDYYTRRKYNIARDAQLQGTAGSISLIGGSRPVIPVFDSYARDHVPAQPAPEGGPQGAAPPVPAPAPVPETTTPVPDAYAPPAAPTTLPPQP